MARSPYAKWAGHNPGAYRSGLEVKLADQLESAGVVAKYEEFTVAYEIPASMHKYTPDYVLPNGIVIEGKGIFDSDDRKKHTLIREQHPELDIRFVFSNANAKLYKGSPTTYAKWCEKNGFQYATKVIPKEWLTERRKTLPVSLQRKQKKETS